MRPSFLKNDFPLIRKSVITLVLSLLFSATLIGVSHSVLLKLKSDMDREQAQRGTANEQLHRAENDKQEILDFQPKYLQLRERGVVGIEKRLDWIEQINTTREERNLFPIAYDISAQQIFKIDPSVLTGDLELRGSKMKLEMKLLHEQDLFNFLDDLRRKGFYTVQECTLKRAGVLETPQSPRLAAECLLYWLTLGEHTASHDEIPNPPGRGANR